MALWKVFRNLHQVAEVGQVHCHIGLESIARLLGTAPHTIAHTPQRQTDAPTLATTMRRGTADAGRIAGNDVRRLFDRTKHLVVQAGKTCPEKPIDKSLVKGQNDIFEKMYSTHRLIILRCKDIILFFTNLKYVVKNALSEIYVLIINALVFYRLLK